MEAEQTTEFGPFVFRADRMELVRDGTPLPLGHRALKLLKALATADGVVTKAALMEAGWANSVVEEGNLTVQIAALRRVLGTRPDGSPWIITVPREGYRLVKRSPPAAGTSTPFLAVLPFHNLSSDPEQSYFADGVLQDLITGLSRFRTFAVVAGPLISAFRDRTADLHEVIRQLGASYVLEGSVRKAGDRLRITTQLSDGKSGAQLWAQTFEGTLEDVFAFQDRITEGVVAVVEPSIKYAEIDRARRKPASDQTVYDLYFQALSTATAADGDAVARSIELIERALTIDPTFVPALGVAASAHLALYDRQLPGSGDAQRQRGLGFARAALANAGNDAFVRAVAGYALIVLSDDFDGGMIALRQAATDNPNSAAVQTYFGTGALHAGTLAEAEEAMRRALKLNVNDISAPWALTGLAHIAMCRQDYDAALEWAHRAQLSSLQNNGPNLWILTAANALLGRNHEAQRWRGVLETRLPDTTIAALRRGQRMRDPLRIEVIIEGLRRAGVRER